LSLSQALENIIANRHHIIGRLLQQRTKNGLLNLGEGSNSAKRMVTKDHAIAHATQGRTRDRALLLSVSSAVEKNRHPSGGFGYKGSDLTVLL
jgi:hypothetical protein